MHIITINSGKSIMVPSDINNLEDANKALTYYISVLNDEMGKDFTSSLENCINIMNIQNDNIPLDQEIDSCYESLEYKDTQLMDIEELTYELLKISYVSRGVKARKLVEEIQRIASDR